MYEMTITECVTLCLKSFTEIVEVARPVAPCESRFNAEYNRFKIWAGNVGAHRVGKISLDHRLREALALRERVTGLLDELVESMADGKLVYKSILNGDDD